MSDDTKPSPQEEKDQLEKIRSLQEMIATAERTITSAKQMMSQINGGKVAPERNPEKLASNPENQIVLGTFDGQIMIGEDGKQYPVPANYASKSKLVEGDTLKLTITQDGSFVYKQIGPTERRYLIGTVEQDDKGNYFINTEEKKFRVLLAAATYFKIEPGDEITIVIPREKESTWSAIENVVRKVSDINFGNPTPQNEPAPTINAISEQAETNNTIEENIEEKEEEVKKPSAIEKLEKEIEEERKRQAEEAGNDSILDEWTPDVEELKKEAKQPAKAEA